MLVTWHVAGCSHGPGSTPVANADIGKLCVLQVWNRRLGSGFPVDGSRVVTAAHVFKGEGLGPSAIVAGRPMQASIADWQSVASRPAEDDWLELHCGRAWFTPNMIDPQIALEPRDRVLVGGFRAAAQLADPIERACCPPEVVEGTVVRRPFYVSESSDDLVCVAVSYGDYGGFSGGPAATLDGSGDPRVWGLVVRQYSKWSILPCCRRTVLVILRIPERALSPPEA